MSTVADRVGEVTAVITSELEEKDRSLQVAVTQTERLSEEKSGLENQVTEMQTQNSSLKETVAHERAARETMECSLQATIAEQAGTLQKGIDERTSLAEQNQRLMIEAARSQEAANHKAEEITRMKMDIQSMQEAIHEERRKTAVSEERARLATEALAERTEEIRKFSGMEHTLLEQFKRLQDSLLVDKKPAERVNSGHGKNAGRPQPNA